ncbi:MAG: hypothetical protein DIU62_011720 [Pseudomonadota bacterium]|jgi:hypothetical protein
MDTATTPAGRRNIIQWLIGSALVAAVLLFTIVLPAEYGYDPTGIGRALGLTQLSPRARAADAGLDGVIEDLLAGNDDLDASAADPMQPLPLPNPAISQLEDTPPKTQMVRVRLDFDGRTEVKAVMKKAKAILYSWKVEGGEVYVDFHGHDPARGDGFWVRYEEAGQEQGITGRSGSLVAPFDGEHGWYWLNTSEGPVTIELTVTGYFDRLVDYGPLQ